MCIQILINTKAGTALSQSLEDLEEDIQSGLSNSKQHILVHKVSPKDLSDKLKKVAQSTTTNTVVVAGGDGTIRAAASILIGTNKALGIIPLGTFNRLARELHIPLNPHEAAKALVHGQVKKIDVAELNGDIFLCNSFIGLPPYFTEKRQNLRGQPFRERLKGYFRVAKTIFDNSQKFSLYINDGHEAKRLRVLSIAISNNPYTEEPSLTLERASFDSGQLGLYISKHQSVQGIAWSILRASMGFWKGDPKIECRKVKSLEIRSPKRKIKLSNDGELEKIAPPLYYKILPRSLNVIVPKIL